MMISIDCSESFTIGRLESRSLEEMITGLSKMLRCMMLKAEKFQGLEATDTLGRQRTFLESKMSTNEKSPSPLKRQQLNCGNPLMRNTLEMQRLLMAVCRKSKERRKRQGRRRT